MQILQTYVENRYRTNASFGNLDKCFKLLNKIETCTMCIGLTGS